MGREEPPDLAKSGSHDRQPENKPDAVDTLRDLIAGPQLAALNKRLDDPVVRAREVARVLPEAVRTSAAAGDQISKVLRPAIEASIKSSVRKNPRALVDAIFPVMGPALRKAVAATVMGMIQSLSHIINHSFSIRGIRWRIEALRTRTSYAEIVLLHTLVYQVEQVFLIHKESGLVLQHVVAGGAISQDPDLVSGMLTAIQSFVTDSFDAGQGEALDTLRVGTNLSVWIEQGPQATLAAVIRGTPPMDLRQQIREVLDHVHLHHAADLEAFDGDTAAFNHLQDPLEECLSMRIKPDHRKISPLVWVLLLAAAGALLWGLYHWMDTQKKWRRLVAELNAAEGVVVTVDERIHGRWVIRGLRDPLAADISAIIGASGLPPDKVETHWEAYHALSPTLTLKRAQQVLQPPSGVRLTLNGNRLKAEGFATHAWIETARQRGPSIPGIVAIEIGGVVDMDRTRFDAAVARIESKIVYFNKQGTQFAPDQEESLLDLSRSVLSLQRFGSDPGINFSLMIIGHTDTSGKREANLRLSRERALQVQLYLIQQGCDPAGITILGVGDQALAVSQELSVATELNRSVTFRIIAH